MFEASDVVELVRALPLQAPRRPSGLRVEVLLRLLDEIDYGMILLGPDGQIQHANHLARHELATGQVIRNEQDQLVAANVHQTQTIQAVAARAAQGHRSIIELGGDKHSIAVAFVPLGNPYEDDMQSVLVLFGKRHLCEAVTMSFFARAYGLTPTEEMVLKALCNGMAVDDIARSHGVAQSTVRTQVRVLRAKTSCTSIRELIRKVSTLPPVVPAMRSAPTRPC